MTKRRIVLTVTCLALASCIASVGIPTKHVEAKVVTKIKAMIMSMPKTAAEAIAIAKANGKPYGCFLREEPGGWCLHYQVICVSSAEGPQIENVHCDIYVCPDGDYWEEGWDC